MTNFEYSFESSKGTFVVRHQSYNQAQIEYKLPEKEISEN